MQFGLAEIIGTAGVVLATGVGIVQIWFAYIQVRNTKKDSLQAIKPNENETDDKSKQDALIKSAVSHQLQGNLYEAKSLIEKAKAIPIENSRLLTLERQLNTELTKPYVSKMSGRVIANKLFSKKRLKSHTHQHSGSKNRSKEYMNLSRDQYNPNSSMGCISLILMTFRTIIFTLVETFFYLFSRKFSFLTIFVFTGLIYLLLKWFNF